MLFFNNLILIELRLKKGISRHDLAQIMDVSDGTIANWEIGRSKPRIADLKKLAEYFEVPMAKPSGCLSLQNRRHEKNGDYHNSNNPVLPGIFLGNYVQGLI